jgi:putative nucleotidyltransferase with HDIG domain
MKKVFESPRAGGNVRRAVQMVDSVVESALKSEDPLNDITALIAHDYYTYTHSVNVCVFLVATSRELLGVTSPSALKRVGRGAILHDIGKSQIPVEIINKKGKLDADEWEQMKQHPELGLEIAGRYISLSGVAADVIRHHHEHFDGSGYPDGLEGTRIRPVVQLSTVVDVYDAVTTRRSYAEASAPYSALKMMVEEMQGHFSLPVLRAFIRFLGPEEYSRDARVHRPASVA